MKIKKSLTLRQKNLLRDHKNFFLVFNEIHNSHLTTNVGQVKVSTDEEKNKHKKKK